MDEGLRRILPLDGFQTIDEGFRKITPVDGFDRRSRDNARQNNYAWSIEELGDYIYIGTGRNIVYSVLASGLLGISVPEEFTPRNLDMGAEIWRAKKGSRRWERVYEAAPDSGIIGFRFMQVYTSPKGETALYAGIYSEQNKILVAKYTDGGQWEILDTGITTGNSTRAMIVHRGKLYMSVINESGTFETQLYWSTDPKGDGWHQVVKGADTNKNPKGEGTVLRSFNGKLYVATAYPGGFEVWRTEGPEPEPDKWKLVVDKGAGDALNEIPLSMNIFRDHMYVGSAITFAILSVDPNRGYVQPKGCDIIRFDKNDNWELVVGSKPKEPTHPTYGTRGKAISGLPSGFGDWSNGYCWQLQEFEGVLYAGTWDWSVLLPPLYRELQNNEQALEALIALLNNEILEFILRNPEIFNLIMRFDRFTFGFDFWKTKDGVHWEPISINGLGYPHNYGLRNIFASRDGDLYLGTANPFDGCQVWVKRGKFYGSEDAGYGRED